MIHLENHTPYDRIVLLNDGMSPLTKPQGVDDPALLLRHPYEASF